MHVEEPCGVLEGGSRRDSDDPGYSGRRTTSGTCVRTSVLLYRGWTNGHGCHQCAWGENTRYQYFFISRCCGELRRELSFCSPFAGNRGDNHLRDSLALWCGLES